MIDFTHDEVNELLEMLADYLNPDKDTLIENPRSFLCDIMDESNAGLEDLRRSSLLQTLLDY